MSSMLGRVEGRSRALTVFVDFPNFALFSISCIFTYSPQPSVAFNTFLISTISVDFKDFCIF